MPLTIKELKLHNDAWVLIRILNEKRAKLTNPNTPIAERLREIESKLNNNLDKVQNALDGKEEIEEEHDLEVEILQHTIAIDWSDSDKDNPDNITEADEEHISDMIKEGYNQGELNSYQEDEVEYQGWWKIKR